MHTLKPKAKEGHLKVVGISEMVISDLQDDVLVTYSLGSCIAVAAWDKVERIGGIIHCLLPRGNKSPEQAKSTPARFVDVGVTQFLKELFEAGARRESLVIKIAGASSPLKEVEGLRIGERNYATLKKVFWKNSLLVEAARVGGSLPRTLSLRIEDGRTAISSGRIEEEI